jgi:TPR repeat protein
MYFKGLGTAQDYAQAFEWFSKAAERADPSAKTNLGYMYMYGRGVALDYAQARAWFRKAASMGSGSAKAWLRWMDTQLIASSTRNSPE